MLLGLIFTHDVRKHIEVHGARVGAHSLRRAPCLRAIERHSLCLAATKARDNKPVRAFGMFVAALGGPPGTFFGASGGTIGEKSHPTSRGCAASVDRVVESVVERWNGSK